jgi:hypothetical protein
MPAPILFTANLILALALVCSSAHADTLTSGTLSFTCDSGAGCLLPTSGSFDYDNNMGQFLSIGWVWNGLTVFFNDFIDYPALVDLTTSSMQWDAGSTFDFHSSDAGTIPMEVEVGVPLLPGASNSGSVSATDITSTVVNLIISEGPPVNLTPTSTPEPGTLGLVGVGFALIWRRLKPR